MGIGVSIFLLALGAILTFAVEASVSGLDLGAIGVILMIAGAIGLVLTFAVFGRRDRTVAMAPTAVREERVIARERDVY